MNGYFCLYKESGNHWPIKEMNKCFMTQKGRDVFFASKRKWKDS